MDFLQRPAVNDATSTIASDLSLPDLCVPDMSSTAALCSFSPSTPPPCASSPLPQSPSYFSQHQHHQQQQQHAPSSLDHDLTLHEALTEALHPCTTPWAQNFLHGETTTPLPTLRNTDSLCAATALRLHHVSTEATPSKNAAHTPHVFDVQMAGDLALVPAFCIDGYTAGFAVQHVSVLARAEWGHKAIPPGCRRLLQHVRFLRNDRDGTLLTVIDDAVADTTSLDYTRNLTSTSRLRIRVTLRRSTFQAALTHARRVAPDTPDILAIAEPAVLLCAAGIQHRRACPLCAAPTVDVGNAGGKTATCICRLPWEEPVHTGDFSVMRRNTALHAGVFEGRLLTRFCVNGVQLFASRFDVRSVAELASSSPSSSSSTGGHGSSDGDAVAMLVQAGVADLRRQGSGGNDGGAAPPCALGIPMSVRGGSERCLSDVTAELSAASTEAPAVPAGAAAAATVPYGLADESEDNPCRTSGVAAVAPPHTPAALAGLSGILLSAGGAAGMADEDVDDVALAARIADEAVAAFRTEEAALHRMEQNITPTDDESTLHGSGAGTQPQLSLSQNAQHLYEHHQQQQMQQDAQLQRSQQRAQAQAQLQLELEMELELERRSNGQMATPRTSIESMSRSESHTLPRPNVGNGCHTHANSKLAERERRAELRRERNRAAAQRSNRRRKLRNDGLKRALGEAHSRAAMLRARESFLREENLRLRRLLSTGAPNSS